MKRLKSMHDFEVDGIYYNITDSEKLTVEVTFRGSSYSEYSNEYSGNVVIPQTVTYNNQTYSVTSIGLSAFENCRSLTSITIPNSVTSIGLSAFLDCSSLTSITIPNSVTSISRSAFNGCSSLTSVTIPNSVTSIGDYAFYGTAWYNNQPDGVVYAGKVAYKYKGTMPSNTSIELAEGTLGIAGGAFYNCSNLTSITIPNSVTSIGDDAFHGCSSLTSVHISDIAAWCNIKFDSYTSNPLYYAKHLYMNGKEITELKIPDGVTSIGSYAFEDCHYLTSVTIPNSVTSIGSSAFSGCDRLSSITIPDGVTSIGYEAFSGCSNLTSITIPNSVTSIGADAFWDCRSLTSIIIPNSVTSIGDEAFYNCSSLTSVKVLAETPPVAYITTFNNYDIELCVPEKSLEIYKATSPWSSFVNIIALAPPSTTSLTIGSTGSTTFSSIYNLDFSNVEGLKAYTATGYNSDNGELTLVRIKEAKADGTGEVLAKEHNSIWDEWEE